MKKMFLIFGALFTLGALADHMPFPGKEIPKEDYYRALTLKLRQKAEFEIPFPGMTSSISYSFSWDKPIYEKVVLGDAHLDQNKPYFMRMFFDRILFGTDSYLLINGEKLPLTCVFIDGQDNRFMDNKTNPLFPDLILKVYLVANDFSCQGPIKPGWPMTGGKEENWDTYLYYEIRDPTIMIPTEAKLRYRWNEYHVVLVDRGQP